mmetsp:Transcript_32249/g.57814  ORF Transcript_32249/g.57814 Transcript_32249/m.57814 type:complete len:226 (-) Transcript_32249:1154-1831(-)
MAAWSLIASPPATAPSSCCLSQLSDSRARTRCHAASTSAPVIPASVAARTAAPRRWMSPEEAASPSSRPWRDCVRDWSSNCALATSCLFTPALLASSMQRLSCSGSFAEAAASKWRRAWACISNDWSASLAPASSCSPTWAPRAAAMAALSLYTSPELAASRSSWAAPARARKFRRRSLALATSGPAMLAASAPSNAAIRRLWSSPCAARRSSSEASARAFECLS